MAATATDLRFRLGLCSLQFSVSLGIRSQLLAMPSPAHQVPRALTVPHPVHHSVCSAHLVLTAPLLPLLHRHPALPAPPPRSATIPAPLMHPSAACAPLAPAHLYRVQTLVCPAKPVRTSSLLVSNTATCAKRVLTGRSSAPAREQPVVFAPPERFQKMDR